MKKLALLLTFAFLASACGSARVVRRTTYDGTIALQGDRTKAMEDAHRQMAAHCGPNNYDIVSEGEVVVGQETVQDSAAQVRRDGRAARSQTVTSTSNKTEWQVTYQCRGAAAPAPAPAPPPAPAPGY